MAQFLLHQLNTETLIQFTGKTNDMIFINIDAAHILYMSGPHRNFQLNVPTLSIHVHVFILVIEA